MECYCCKNICERETKRRKISESSFLSSAKVYLPTGSAQRWTTMSSTSSTKTCSGVSPKSPQISLINSENEVLTKDLKVKNNGLRSTLRNSLHVDTENESACLTNGGGVQDSLHVQYDEKKCHTESTLSESSWECSDADNCEVCLYIKHVHDGLKMKPSYRSRVELRPRVQFKENNERKKISINESGNSLTIKKKSVQAETPQRYGKALHCSESMKSLTRNDIDHEMSKKHFTIQKNSSKECRDTFLLKIPLPFIEEEDPIPISLHQGLTIYRNYYKKDHPIVQYMTLFNDISDLKNSTHDKSSQKGFVKLPEMEINVKGALRTKKDWNKAPMNLCFSETETKLVKKEEKFDKNIPKDYIKVIAVLVKTPTRMVSFKKEKFKNFLKPTISSELKNSCLMRSHLKNRMQLDVSGNRCTSSCIRLNKTQEQLYEEATRITKRVMQKYSVRKTNNATNIKKNVTTPLLASHSSLMTRIHSNPNDRFEEHIRIMNECASLEKCLSKLHVSEDAKNVILASDASSHAFYLNKASAKNLSQYDGLNKLRCKELKECTPFLDSTHAHSKDLSEKQIPEDWFIEPKGTEELLLCDETIPMQKICSLYFKVNQEEDKMSLMQTPYTSKIQDIKKKTYDFDNEVGSKQTEMYLKMSTSSSSGNQYHSEQSLKKNECSETLHRLQDRVTYYKYRCPALCSNYEKKIPNLGGSLNKNVVEKYLPTSKSPYKDFKRSPPLQSWPLMPKKTTTSALKFNNAHSDSPVNALNRSAQSTNFHRDGHVLQNLKKIGKCTNTKKTTQFQLTREVCLNRKQKQTDVPLKNVRQENRGSLSVSRQPLETLKECESVQCTQSCEIPSITLCAAEPNMCKEKYVVPKDTYSLKSGYVTVPVNQKITYTVLNDPIQENASKAPTLCKNSDDIKKKMTYLTNVANNTFSIRKGKEEVESQGQSCWKSVPKGFSTGISKENITPPAQLLSDLDIQSVAFSKQAYEGQKKMVSYVHPELTLSMKEGSSLGGNGYPTNIENQGLLNCKEDVSRIQSSTKCANYSDFQFSQCGNMKTLEKVPKYWIPTETTSETCLPILPKNSYTVEGKKEYSAYHSYPNFTNSEASMSYFLSPSAAFTKPYFIPYYPKQMVSIPFQSERNQNIYTTINENNTVLKTIPMESSLTMEQIKSMLSKANACYEKQIHPSHISKL
jgi:hypothetical protein